MPGLNVGIECSSMESRNTMARVPLEDWKVDMTWYEKGKQVEKS
jgi:hypothetical protein